MGMKRALVTGASRGIGKETAFLLAEQGYDLDLCCNKSIEELTKVAKEITEKHKVSVRTIKCDLSSAKEIQKMTDEINEAGGVDVIINNAGISFVGLMTQMSDLDWDKVIETNLTSVFRICRNLLPNMIAGKKGRIINVSSVWGNQGASMEVAYSASKGGINAFTRALAKELAPSNIQVNAIAFGCIDTDMMKCYDNEEIEALREEIPADRIATPKEAARMIINVLNAPDYMTGQIITMDGGWI